ncbi:hypothetical protein GQ42DRAFT_165577 [Ramicandelaber brevisporus]|nr:hypothetical protein GQ42DRAFT_165577 [Ramicandelaber brevisporus]
MASRGGRGGGRGGRGGGGGSSIIKNIPGVAPGELSRLVFTGPTQLFPEREELPIPVKPSANEQAAIEYGEDYLRLLKQTPFNIKLPPTKPDIQRYSDKYFKQMSAAALKQHTSSGRPLISQFTLNVRRHHDSREADQDGTVFDDQDGNEQSANSTVTEHSADVRLAFNPAFFPAEIQPRLAENPATVKAAAAALKKQKRDAARAAAEVDLNALGSDNEGGDDDGESKKGSDDEEEEAEAEMEEEDEDDNDYDENYFDDGADENYDDLDDGGGGGGDYD